MFRNISMYPLLARDPEARRVPGYRILDDALASGLVEVTEVSEQGSVPHCASSIAARNAF